MKRKVFLLPHVCVISTVPRGQRPPRAKADKRTFVSRHTGVVIERVSKCSAINTIRWAQSNYILQHIHYTHTQYLRARAHTHTHTHTHTQIGSNETPPPNRSRYCAQSMDWTEDLWFDSRKGKTGCPLPQNVWSGFIASSGNFTL